ncbi:uncharacterized protein BX663DRAFT_497291, partial [Cokeromyces recurvatus]|uniref:uncharacterized protein n=1 Tax=Cokeromyces recurvatus TaxID=90255 RepID=UPI00221F4CC1
MVMRESYSKDNSFRDKKHSYIKQAIKDEIKELKEKVRAAYALNIRKNDGDKLTEDELRTIEEVEINNKMIGRLNNMLEHQSTASSTPTSYSPSFTKTALSDRIGENEVWAIMQLFYLVRLCQQGFFYFITATYPYLELEAISYLCDQMITASLYTSVTNNTTPMTIDQKNIFAMENRDKTRTLAKKLVKEADEPVGPGYKTTFKQIMTVIRGLVNQSLASPISQMNNSEQQTFNKEATQQPPIWVFMPYCSMIGSFPMNDVPPVTLPTVPFPSTMLPPNLVPLDAFQMTSDKQSEQRSTIETNDLNNKESTSTVEMNSIDNKDPPHSNESKETTSQAKLTDELQEEDKQEESDSNSDRKCMDSEVEKPIEHTRMDSTEREADLYANSIDNTQLLPDEEQFMDAEEEQENSHVSGNDTTASTTPIVYSTVSYFEKFADKELEPNKNKDKVEDDVKTDEETLSNTVETSSIEASSNSSNHIQLQHIDSTNSDDEKHVDKEPKKDNDEKKNSAKSVEEVVSSWQSYAAEVSSAESSPKPPNRTRSPLRRGRSYFKGRVSQRKKY